MQITDRVLTMYHDLTLFTSSYAAPLCEITTNNKALYRCCRASREKAYVQIDTSRVPYTRSLCSIDCFLSKEPHYTEHARLKQLLTFSISLSISLSLSSLDLSYAFGLGFPTYFCFIFSSRAPFTRVCRTRVKMTPLSKTSLSAEQNQTILCERSYARSLSTTLSVCLQIQYFLISLTQTRRND